MSELVYAHHLKWCLVRDVGSTPTPGTKLFAFSKQFINALPMLFSQVYCDVHERYILGGHGFLQEFAEFFPFALGEFQGRLFLGCREDGDEYCRALQVRRAGSVRYGDEGCAVVFPRQKSRRELLDVICYFVFSF